ncbi:di-trans,poly-cis-decaprenylcistransferase [Candidatus Berkelbacteria bacterium]|nr:di-trans,poly-cis-decaprenylcistransferase [Candidatus Berkelbacteria bacterium]
MDGNRRWATAAGLPTYEGHRAGMENLRQTVDHALQRGVKFLTVYAFSTENWLRTKPEVTYLLNLIPEYINKERAKILEQGIRFRVLGQLDRFPAKIRQLLEEMVALTKDHTRLTFNICLSYGGRDEIVRAVKRLLHEGIESDSVTEDLIRRHLDTGDSPDPELIIRTSGEQRLSNFLTWQAVYSELYFSPIPWPAFDTAAFDVALTWYSNRRRRFGK